MHILLGYLKQHRLLILLALFLAAINQVFSLLDPLIFRHIIDRYATRYDQYTTGQFIRGVLLLLGAAVGVAFVSRVAKNFQDYFVNVSRIRELQPYFHGEFIVLLHDGTQLKSSRSYREALVRQLGI